MIHLFTTVLSLYVILRLVLPLRVAPRVKVALCLLALACSMKLYLLRLIYGSIVPEISRSAMLALGYVHGTLILLTILCVMRDILLLCLRGANRILPRVPRDILSPNRWAALLLILSLALGVFAVRQGVAEPLIHEVDVTLPGMPRALDGLRVLHASDLHISRTFPREWTAALVERINASRPDIILLTGDMVDGTIEDRARDVAPLAGLKARLGVYMCTGNHEYHWDWPAWKRAFEALGIVVLENAHVTIADRGTKIVVAGVADRIAKRFGLPMPDPAAALAGAPKDALRVMLAHRPQVVYDATKEGVDLQLSGHTHGGQLAVARLLVKLMNEGFLSGVYAVGDTRLHVTNGTALWSGFPMRLLVPCRFELLTLKAPPASN
ncbi:MAG: metallophosphoesterase [Desulfovibrio sp.]|jgi:predicted MPP superfamily phosphohydrolase|nr:metallophosphoesterase [Desulfovibrio sp.]